MQANHPIAILIRGLPGSGKSYLASELQKSLGSEKVVMLDPDAIDFDSQAYKDHVAACQAEGIDESLFPYRFLRAQAYAGIEAHKIVIWNQPFTNIEIFEKMVGRLLDHAAAQNTSLPILVVEVEVNPAAAKERVAERKQAGGHGPSDNTFERFTGEYASVAAQGYRIVTVEGEADVAVSVASVLDALSEVAN